MSVDWQELRARYDPVGIGRIIERYPEMVRAPLELSGEVPEASGSILVCGMGVSALSAELYRDARGPEWDRELSIHRSYELPGWVSVEDLVICSSYSGDTEEVITLYEESLRRGLVTVAMTTGGRLAELARGRGRGLERK